MGDQLFRCRHCKKLRNKRSKEQHYCGSEACQKARKNAWRRSRLKADADYRANQRASTQAWLDSQGGSGAYYRNYRKRRRLQARCAGNVECAAQQVPGPAAAAATQSDTNSGAKSDAELRESRVRSGTYRLVSCDDAKSDAVVVQLFVIQGG
jgi:hypothetical protein